MSLFFSVSGLRGIAFLTLTPEYVLKVSATFCDLFDVPILVVGRDPRPSGKCFHHLVIASSLSREKFVLDGRIAPTPSIVYAVKKREKSSIGIVISASHNPPEWNGLKFIHPEGRFLFENEIERLKKEVSFFSWEKIKNVYRIEKFSPVKEHIDGIIENKFILKDLIREKRFRVAIDTAGGAGSKSFPKLLSKLGCEVLPFNTQMGVFERPLEVNTENIREFGNFVKEKKADIGFAIDADGDRLQIVTKDGKILSEEETLPICLNYLLSVEKKDIVTNFSTTEQVEEVAEKFGVKVYRTKVGEANIVKKMIEEEAGYGGEGNGGVIVRDFNMTRDALFASAIVLSFLTQFNDSREFKKLFKKRFMKKLKFFISERRIPEKILDFTQKLNFLEINGEDGVRLKFDSGFIHIRPSNTEPVLRVIIESEEKEVVEEWERKIRGLI
ncbi:MAG: hypothetical protein ABDH49_03420 [Candidatus Hydrothermales bacterium]